MPGPTTATLATRAWLPAERVAGDRRAPVVVLLHGITGWSRTWWRVGPALAERGWYAVGIDLRGHGASPRIEGAATATGLADDVATTLDALDLAHVDGIVAHSLGAAVTLELVAARPDMARRLVLEDPPGQTRVDDVEYQAGLAAEVSAARGQPDTEIARELRENPHWAAEDARQDIEGKAVCDVDGILSSLRANTGVRTLELAPGLTVPALYLVAEESRSALGARRSELLATLPASAEAIEFDAGHTIHRDRPDDYVAAVAAWLERR
jgi:pimeloyl-ACP methyl ester carboxylesterase